MKLASIWNSFKANTRRTKVVTAFTLAILLWAIAGFFKRNAWFFLPILLCLGDDVVGFYRIAPHWWWVGFT
ncbi:hypothetical protein GM415_04435 [Pseudodesulfovibrio cashew]|uniref:Uncharacterized protein n=1 Tax=Pseudodesulfovibrio cashew TaxID=2678688 RepID=A0A6I6JEG3_9BACT|nr:hypothetical protein [Pseudodesulfovibrio cashew]QGY39398.1 hypothetical protein GM415_04435 [Pseudodesulfovibrio cashew]